MREPPTMRCRGNQGRRRPHRAGMTLFVALAVLVVVSLLAADMLRRTALAQQEVISTRRQLQASLLAESGLARARLARRLDPSYVGETWRLSAADLELPPHLAAANSPAAVVTIKVITNVAGQPTGIMVIAEFPAASLHRVRVRRDEPVDAPRTSIPN